MPITLAVRLCQSISGFSVSLMMLTCLMSVSCRNRGILDIYRTSKLGSFLIVFSLKLLIFYFFLNKLVFEVVVMKKIALYCVFDLF